jgi:hypothetical protein
VQVLGPEIVLIRRYPDESPVGANIEAVPRPYGEGAPDVVEHLAVIVLLTKGEPSHQEADVVIKFALIEIWLDVKHPQSGIVINPGNLPVVMPVKILVRPVVDINHSPWGR